MEASTVFNPKMQQPAGLSAIALKRCRETRRLRAFMKLAAAALALLTGLLTASAQNAPCKLERTRLFGSDYIRLTDWAEAYRFQMFWTRRNEEVQLASSWSKLEFTVDSHKAGINGVTVYLSAPVALRHGAVFISLLDLQTTVQPVLFPPKNTVNVPILSVCLDPGHGGRDPGNKESRRQGKEYTLLLAQEVRDWLDRKSVV